jgi:hypothetical protein
VAALRAPARRAVPLSLAARASHRGGRGGVSRLDVNSGKAIAAGAVEARFSRHGNVVAVAVPTGASLLRLGDLPPFARLPVMPSFIEATPDASRVVTEGALVWSEAGGCTARGAVSSASTGAAWDALRHGAERPP